MKFPHLEYGRNHAMVPTIYTREKFNICVSTAGGGIFFRSPK